jgi:magnesium-transporting ATPase (P-type)
MIPHRRQLRDDRKVVELGRGLSDNLVKYIRFQMSVLAGMIITFLGASILNVASGVPFTPLHTLWVNFTTQVFQAVGLGFTTFALANLFFSFTARDELRSVCSLDTVNDRTFLTTSLMSVAALVFVTELPFFQRVFDIVELPGNQLLICIGAALTIVVASEIRKSLLRRREPAATAEQAPTETVPA